jgi:hypothetical protein
MTTSSPLQTEDPPQGLPLLRPGLLAVGAAGLAAAVVHVVFDLAGADFVVEPPGQARAAIGLPQAVGVAVLTSAVGLAVLALVVRRTRRPARLLVGLTVLGLLLFAANPVLAADQALTVVALEVMHLAVAGAFLAVLLPVVRRSPR